MGGGMTIVYRSDGAAISNAVMDDNFEQLCNRYQDVNTASATNISPVTGYTYYTISGNTDITSISDVGLGKRIYFKFNSAGGAIGHATNLIMPGATTITWRAGDCAIFVNVGTGIWRCISYMRGDISPMGAVTQADGNATTLAASTEFVDLYGSSNSRWSLLTTFTATDTSPTLGETTAIPAGTKAIRILYNNLGTTSGTATWEPRLRLSSSSSYPASPFVGATARTASGTYSNASGYRLAGATNVGDSGDSNTGVMEFWNISGTYMWVGGGMNCETQAPIIHVGQGVYTLVGVLDRLKIDLNAGTTNYGTGSAEIWTLN